MGTFDGYPCIDLNEGINRVGGNKKLYSRLLNTFITNTREQELLDAINAKDYSKTAMAAHAIKGVAANLSFLRLRFFAASIEEAVNNAKATEDAAVFDTFDTAEINRIIGDTLAEAQKAVAEYTA